MNPWKLFTTPKLEELVWALETSMNLRSDNLDLRHKLCSEIYFELSTRQDIKPLINISKDLH